MNEKSTSPFRIFNDEGLKIRMEIFILNGLKRCIIQFSKFRSKISYEKIDL